MTRRLEEKIKKLLADPQCGEFILADAKDPDMAWGITSAGTAGNRWRTMAEFLDQIRAIVQQDVIDIMLASVSTMSKLAHMESLFRDSDVTPAVRANDSTDVWSVRASSYSKHPSLPFSSSFIEEAQYGTAAIASGDPIVNLGLYSITFVNDAERDRDSLAAFRQFRSEAQLRGFKYFLEVFPPNVDCGIQLEDIPAFVNDSICRMLAGVSLPDRPLFLKIPYFGSNWLEELVAYDPSVIVGILGGSSGTTLDAFQLLADAQRYGARVALFGRKIKNADDPLAFIKMMRCVVDRKLSPTEAVRAYHAELQSQGVIPSRSLADDLLLTIVQSQTYR